MPAPSRLCLLVALLATTALGGDWPIWRHDARRTGFSAGTSNLTAPGVYWGSYMGGGLASGYGLWALDLDGDGTAELLTAVGGRIVARNLLNRVVARSPVLGLYGIIGIADVDGDGTKDVVVVSGNRNYVLKGTDLSIEWSERASDLGDWGGTVMGDITGDGRADLVIREGGCGGRANGNAGFAYSFGAGFAAAVTPSWSLPQRECGNSVLSLANVDTTPALEVLTNFNNTLQVRDGATGCLLAQSPAQPQSYLGMITCFSGNIDGVVGAEFVCLADRALHGTNAHAAITVKYTPSASRCSVQGTLAVTQAALAPDLGGALNRQGVDPLVDLDGDGSFELVVSARANASAPWNTLVLNALNPTTTRTSLTGQALVGWGRTGAGGRVQVVTSNAGALTGWEYTATPTPALTQVWSLPGLVAPLLTDQADFARHALALRLVTLDFDHDGVDELVTLTTPTAGLPNSIVVYSLVTASMPRELRRFALPGDAQVQLAVVLPPVSSARSQLAIVTNLGVLVLFDDALQPVDFAGQEFRTGGFAGVGPRAFANGDAGTSVFAVDSAQGLRRIDVLGSTNLFPAQPIWRRANIISGASIVSTNGVITLTAAGLAEPVTSPPQSVVRQLDFDGGTRWSSAPITGGPSFDPTPVKLNADAVPDYVLQWWDYAADDRLRFRAYNGVDGAPLWTDPYAYLATAGSTGYACADWNGDGIDDIVAQGIPGTGYFTGTTGAPVATGLGTTDSYFNPVLYDFDGNGLLDVLLQGGYSPVTLLNHGFGVLYNTGDDDRPYPNGGVVECPGGLRRFVQGSTLYPGALKVTTLNASYAFQKLYLAAGQAFATQAAANAASPYVGYLGHTSVHSNLSGTGHPTAVVGSDEGYLYAVNPCTTPATLEYAVNLGAAVDEPIFADTDGDGNDEIIVGTADGFLYGLRQRVLPAPSWVWDTDPPRVTNADVDQVDTHDSLSAKWAAVPGAVSYEVGVARAGLPIVTPAWSNVGNVTETTLTGLPLLDGATYLVGVRGLLANGARSPDAVSNGVRVWLKCWGVSCVAQDSCHAAGTCSRATGACSNPGLPEGSACPGGTCQNAVCRLNQGGTCTVASQCGSGFCVDGVCCDRACDQACDACAVAAGAAVDGTCAVVGAGQPGSPTCAPYVCDGANATCPSSCTGPLGCAAGQQCKNGVCRPPSGPGASCQQAAECASGFCVDGVCCDQACAGACDACAGHGHDGTCTAVPAGGAGSPSCAPLACDGTSANCPGARPVGAACSADQACASGFCTDGVCCDQRCDGACAACARAAGAAVDGHCGPLSVGSAGDPVCAPLRCDGVTLSCPTSCSADAQCVEGLVCDQNACVKAHRGYVGFGCGCGATEGGAGAGLGALALLAMVLSRRRQGGVR